VLESLVEQGPAFVRQARIAYVVIDHHRTSERLRTFARRAFRLEPIDEERGLELYRPAP
jgi:hypothetical protein